MGIWYWCADQTIVQRVLGAKDENHARVGPLFAGFLTDGVQGAHDCHHDLPGREPGDLYIETSQFGDAVLSWRLLKKGGILIFDDYRWLLKPMMAADSAAISRLLKWTLP